MHSREHHVFYHIFIYECCVRLARPKMLNTYPIRGLAPGRSWLFAHVMVTLLSVTLTTLGVPGGAGNVLGSGVRCKFKLPLFSTCETETSGEKSKHISAKLETLA